MIFLKSLGLKTWAYIAIFFVVALFIYRVYRYGFDKAQVDSLKKTIETVNKRDENEVYINGLSDSDLDYWLRSKGWIRD